jgi:RNA polymerase sigma factor (sigma-70 family)
MSINSWHEDDDVLAQIIERFNEGDERAWEFVMDSYNDRMIQVAIDLQYREGMRIDVHQAQDITQEAWVLLYTKTQKFRHNQMTGNTDDYHPFQHIGEILKYVRTTQHNLLRNLRRGAHYRKVDSIDEDESDGVLSRSSESAEHEYENNEQLTWLQSILDEILNEFDINDQQIVIRRLLNDERPAHIAQAMDVEVNHVYSVTVKARRKLNSYAAVQNFFLQASRNTPDDANR